MVNDVMDIMGMIKNEITHYGKNYKPSGADITDGLTMCVSTKYSKYSLCKQVSEPSLILIVWINVPFFPLFM